MPCEYDIFVNHNFLKLMVVIGITKSSREIINIINVKMSCVQNCQNVPKYKCPTCRQPYCSVICYKIHKETPCALSLTTAYAENCKDHNTKEYEYPTEDTVPMDKLNLLDKSSELKKCLENPYVREILEILDKSSEPDVLMRDYMTEPIFTEFADACLKVVQPESFSK